MDNHLHVAIATDDAYIMFAGIMIYSLFENNKNWENITVHVLDNGISKDGIDKLNYIATLFDRHVCYYNCTDIGYWLGEKIVNMFKTSDTNVPISAYARLFLPQIIDKKIDKILYLDVDSIVLGDYSALWNKKITNYSVLGVIDNVNSKAKKCIGLDDDYKYINSGVLLMNLNKMREIGFVLKFTDFINKYNGYVYHHDQGIINGVLHDTIGYLEPEYNMMSFVYEYKKASSIKQRYCITDYYSDAQIEYAKANPVFIHFTEGNFQRPWVKGCKHPLKNIWMDYRDKTSWSGSPLKEDERTIKLKIFMQMNRLLPASIMNKVVNSLHKHDTH